MTRPEEMVSGESLPSGPREAVPASAATASGSPDASPPGAARRLVAGPFNRVEGDLEVTLDIVDGKVAAARVNAALYRGFENLLVGRDPWDALVLVPRICGICSVSQSAAAAAALADLSGAQMPANGRRAANLILATEVLADHLTHFYLFFMPDFAREAYRERSWHAEAVSRFKAMQGRAAADFLPARAGLLRVLALLAGKWPHTLALRPGGTTRALQAGEKPRLRLFLQEFRRFLETVLFADRLEAVAALDSAAALARWRHGRDGDFARFLAWAEGAHLAHLGQGSGHYLAAGAYPEGDGGLLLPAGVWSAECGLAPFAPDAIREDHRYAWLADAAAPLHPVAGETRLDAEKPDAYSWCKAPRYAGSVAETGALARQLVAGQPLLHDLVGRDGGSVLARVVARLLEVARLVPVMEQWAAAIEAGQPFHSPVDLPADGHGTGLVEAARGTLGHWLTVERGAITRYQIIAPTTWNFSPRDARGVPGPLEQALVGVPAAERAADSVMVQHVVRSFDPCMACTVH